MHVRGRGAPERGFGGGDGTFFAVRAVGEVVVGLPGGLASWIRGEGTVFGGGARGKGLDVEFGDGVVADEDAGFVLKNRVRYENKVEKV